jgi:hypothetical protein
MMQFSSTLTKQFEDQPTTMITLSRMVGWSKNDHHLKGFLQ